jgi:hypothetical protein
MMTSFMTIHGFVVLMRRWHGPRRRTLDNKMSCCWSGLFRPFAEHTYVRLNETGWMKPLPLQEDLRCQVSDDAHGKKVHITVKALQGLSADSPISYARIVLMETTGSSSIISNDGLHALNILVFPHPNSDLPLWGVSFAKTPTVPSMTMLTLDAQIMNDTADYADVFREWHSRHVRDQPHLPWGGPFRAAVQPYMSEYVLWSKLLEKKNLSNKTRSHIRRQQQKQQQQLYNHSNTDINATSTITSTSPPTDIVQNQVWDAYREHLDIYLRLIQEYAVHVENNNTYSSVNPRHAKYCDFWRYNEPERSTLQTLFGKQWTERLLWQVMFPTSSNGNNGVMHDSTLD